MTGCAGGKVGAGGGAPSDAKGAGSRIVERRRGGSDAAGGCASARGGSGCATGAGSDGRSSKGGAMNEASSSLTGGKSAPV